MRKTTIKTFKWNLCGRYVCGYVNQIKSTLIVDELRKKVKKISKRPRSDNDNQVNCLIYPIVSNNEKIHLIPLGCIQ